MNPNEPLIGRTWRALWKDLLLTFPDAPPPFPSLSVAPPEIQEGKLVNSEMLRTLITHTISLTPHNRCMSWYLQAPPRNEESKIRTGVLDFAHILNQLNRNFWKWYPNIDINSYIRI